MHEPIVLVGGGGHCISCIDVIELAGNYEIIGILDHKAKIGTLVSSYKIIGTDHDIDEFARKYKNFLITIGQITTSSVRRNLQQRIDREGGSFPIIISPLAHVAKETKIGEGTIIMHHALVNKYAVIGSHCIINTKALVEHNSIIGDFCHVSTASVVNGNVTVGSDVFIGSNSIINNNLQICDKVIIPSGSTVRKDIIENKIYKERKF